MESWRRDLLNDMAEHEPILKNSQNTYHPRFGFSPNSIPQNGDLFLLCFYDKIWWGAWCPWEVDMIRFWIVGLYEVPIQGDLIFGKANKQVVVLIPSWVGFGYCGMGRLAAQHSILSASPFTAFHTINLTLYIYWKLRSFPPICFFSANHLLGSLLARDISRVDLGICTLFTTISRISKDLHSYVK